MTAFAIAIMEKVGTMTSSPLPMPRLATARCSAVVPFEQHTPYLVSQKALNFFSNSSRNLPFDETQLVSRHSVTDFFSLPPRGGSPTGIMSTTFIFGRCRGTRCAAQDLPPGQ